MISILFNTAVEMINYFFVLIILITCALYCLGKQLDVQPTKVTCTSANDRKSSEGHNSETDGDDMEADDEGVEEVAEEEEEDGSLYETEAETTETETDDDDDGKSNR